MCGQLEVFDDGFHSPRKISSRNIFVEIFRGFRGHFDDILEDIRGAYILINGIHSCLISNDTINKNISSPNVP